MDRGISSSSKTSTPGYIGAKRLPPWEISDIPRVPHMTRSAPTLSKAEMQALPSLWATTTTPGRPHNPDAEESFPDSTFPSPSPPSRTDTGSFSERKPSLADSARTTSPHPIEQKHMVPAYEQSYEPVPSSHRPPVVALPGTMSSRTTFGQMDMTKPRAYNKQKHKKGSKGPKQSAPLGHRFTSAVKELFRKDPVNDKQFERIGERHWSED